MITMDNIDMDSDNIDELWVFGYGSLMWRPGFDYIEKSPAKCVGYHRCFCIYSYHYRGTKQQPGLVMGLDEGGITYGMAFKIAKQKHGETIQYLREREQINSVYEEVNMLIEVEGYGIKPALFYVSAQEHEQYAGKLPLEQQAKIIVNGIGCAGTNCDYLYNSCDALNEMNIIDDELVALEKMVKLLA